MALSPKHLLITLLCSSCLAICQAQVTADFNGDVLSGCSPLNVKFTDQSSGSVVSWEWNFGNGNQSAQKNPGAIYSAPGVYTVTLKVADSSGATDFISKTGYIHVFANPVADFSVSPDQGCEPLNVQFTDNSTPGTGPITQWRWDFGDGNVLNSNGSTMHSYTHTGTFDVLLEVIDLNGCKAVKRYINVVKVQPRPEFEIKPNTVTDCNIPRTVKFSAPVTNGSGSYSYSWSFGDGGSSTDEEPSHTYTSYGTYDVTLTITNLTTGCIRRKTVPALVTLERPSLDMSVSPTRSCEPASVSYNADAQNFPGSVNYQWNFGDGTFSNAPSGSHSFGAGTWQVKLKVSSSMGCELDSTIEVVVNPKPNADFHAPVRAHCDVPFTANFFGEGKDIIKWEWDFDDGGTANTQNPIYTFYEKGTYDITLVVTNIYGCTDTVVKKDYIYLSDTIAKPVTNTKNLCAPTTVQFYNVLDTILSVENWHWEFIDPFPGPKTSTDPNPSRHYPDTGEFWAVLIIEDEWGCHDTDSIQLSIGSKLVPEYLAIPPEGCGKSLTVNFLNQTDTSAIQPDSFRWDFNAPHTSIDWNPRHTFIGQLQDFPVKLTLYHKQCTSDTGSTVTLNAPLAKIDFVQPRCNPDSVFFYNGSAGADRHFWNFGDGTTSNLESPVKRYEDEGNYQVRYIAVNDSTDCDDTVYAHVEVKFLKANFTANDSIGDCPPLTIQFSDASVPGRHPLKSHKWFFGDGTSSTLRNPQKVYETSDSFTVTLIVSDIYCSDTLVVPDFVKIMGPRGTGEVDINEGCFPLKVNFTSKTEGADRIIWDMGDGSLIDGQNVSFTYNSPGRYIPLLILIDAKGCRVSIPIGDTIWVRDKPSPDFTFNNPCLRQNTVFNNTSTAGEGYLRFSSWNFGDGHTEIVMGAAVVKHAYSAPGIYAVELLLENTYGCRAEIKKDVEIATIGAGFLIKQDRICVNEPVQFMNISKSEKPITQYFWNFDDGTTSQDENPAHIFTRKDWYSVKLIATNSFGCKDTFIYDIAVGDSIDHLTPFIYRVTVEDEERVKMEFAPYPEIDFKAYHFYIKNSEQKWEKVGISNIKSDTVFIYENLSTLNSSYCFNVQFENTCGFFSVLDRTRSHCSVNIEAEPDTNRNIVSWNHYSGWPVQKYHLYRDNADEPSGYSLIATVSGDSSVFIDSSIICYVNHRYRVIANEDGGHLMESKSDWDDALPVYIPVVPAPELRRATVEEDKWILVEWEPQPLVNIRQYILERKDPFGSFEVLNNELSGTTLSYRDRQVEVDDESYTYRIRYIDSCGDVSEWSNPGQTMVLTTDTTAHPVPQLEWSAYNGWRLGTRAHGIEVQDQAGNFRSLASLTDIAELQWEDHQTDLNSLPEYCYQIRAMREEDSASATKNVWSLSNTSCLMVPPTLYAPNVFSPNGNGTNDYFAVQGLFVFEYELLIYDRWGQRVFKSSSLKDQWDGTYRGGEAPDDVYVYIISFSGSDKSVQYLKGNVTLIR
ncbi:MAG: PKD domain-containing protein [Bacteroidia bacterium]